jgi:DNA-binding NarL/FixJ family response regulator
VPSFLLVDDSPTVLMALRHAIHQNRADVKIHEATDASRAMKLFDDARPDVVMMDMVMPEDQEEAKGEDDEPESAGLRLVQEMLARRPGTTIVLVTGLPLNHADVTAAVSLGVVGVLRKPVRPDDVKAALAALFPDADALNYFG